MGVRPENLDQNLRDQDRDQDPAEAFTSYRFETSTKNNIDDTKSTYMYMA